MNVLDENVPDHQRRILRKARFGLHQVGIELGRKGMDDEQVVRLLLQLRRPTLFSFDHDYYQRELCHERYALVWLDVRKPEGARYILRFLTHPEFDTHAKRMGCVVRAAPDGLTVFKRGARQASFFDWPAD